MSGLADDGFTRVGTGLHGRWFRPVAGGEVEVQRDHSAVPAEMAAAVVVRLDLVQGPLRGFAVLELHDADMAAQAGFCHRYVASGRTHPELYRRKNALMAMEALRG